MKRENKVFDGFQRVLEEEKKKYMEIDTTDQ